MSLFFSYHLSLLNFKLKANGKINKQSVYFELSIIEAMSIIQSKYKMQ